MGASKIGKSDRQQCTIKVLYASSGTRQLFLFSLCVVLVMLLCWFESNLFLVVKFEINTLQVECFEDRPMVYSPNHPFPRCIYIYIECSYHRVPWILALCTTWMWWYCCWYPDDDDNDEAPGTAAAFIGAGIFGQHMTSLGPKAPYFLSNALLVEFLWSKRGGHDIFVV